MLESALFAVDANAVITELLTTAYTVEDIGTLDGGVTAADTSITLNSGATAMLAGYWLLKIESELVKASKSGLTLTVPTAQHRGYGGTTAATHANGATVSRAAFTDLVDASDVTQVLAQEGHNWDIPTTVFDIGGGPDGDFAPILKPTVTFKHYGGRDANGRYRDDYALEMARALKERLRAVNHAGLSLTSGVIIAVTGNTVPQLLYDDLVRPPMPFAMHAANFQIKGKE